jgi:hypothetical protein
MSTISIFPKHKERDWPFENVCGERQRQALRALRKTPFTAELRHHPTYATTLPSRVLGEVNSALLAASMEPDDEESWASRRGMWEELACPQSYNSDLFTPPLSPLDPPKQGTSRNENASDEDLREPCTPSPHTIGSHRTQTYKGVQRTVRIADTDPSTPLNSQWPSPLFSDRISSASKKLHKSKSSGLSRTEIQMPNRLDLAIMEEHQSKKNGLLLFHSESLEKLAAEKYSDHSLTAPLRTSKRAPLQIDPFTRSNKIRHGTPLSESQLTTAKTVNFDLLRCCTLLQVKHSDCLKFADNALAVAERAGIHHLVSKSQFYRGLSLMERKRYKEASDAFTRAASVRDWEGKVCKWKIAAERMFRIEAIMEEHDKILVLFDEDPDEYWDDHDR